MRYSTATIIMAAIGVGEVMAGPTHAHLHRKAHEEKREPVDWSALDWDAMDINWSSAYEAGQAASTPAAAAAATATAAAAAAVTTAASIVGDVTTAVGDVAEELFAGIAGASNSLTAFGTATVPIGEPGIGYIGNIGKPYGSNVIKVDSTTGYDYTITFVNPQSSTITINCWNKAGSDGQANSGSALAPHDTTLTFALKSGAQQVVAFQENTQFGCVEAVSAITPSGAFATSWLEGNFASTGSGYDLSAILNPNGNDYNMSISSLEAPECISDMTQNMWLTDSDPVGNSDGSCYIAQSTGTLKVVMAGNV